ncbi:MAG TPA: VCBS repeat-containing protein [Oculatellaceae cyanobacterium]
MERPFFSSSRIAERNQQLLADAHNAGLPYNTASNFLDNHPLLEQAITYSRASRLSTSTATTTATDSVINLVNPDGTYTVAGWTWNPLNAVTNGSIISGQSAISTFASGFLESEGQPLANQTVGSLLSNQSNFSVTLGNSSTRSQIELTWGRQGLLNSVGNDFVVYENGDINEPEGYAVAVRIAGSDTFTPFRYEFYDTFESQLTTNPQAGVLATAFDLSDFGLANGQLIDAIRIINLQPDDLVNGQGQGFLGTSGVSPLDPTTGQPFAVGRLDPDITFVAGLLDLQVTPPPILNIVGTGDFNSDGQPDILLRDGVTGDNAIGLMNGTNITQVVDIVSVADLDWNIVGTGDFNDDLQIDIVWRNQSTGDNAVWLMNGTEFVNAVFLTPVADLNWNIVGTDDFNSDGQVDLLWRNQSTGDNAVWLLNGTTNLVTSYIFPVPQLSFDIVGTGDFNGDGTADIILRDLTTGDNFLVPMNGIVQAGDPIYFSPVEDLDWRIVATDDFNGDGQIDIVWENDPLDLRAVWLMNGINLAGVSYIS